MVFFGVRTCQNVVLGLIRPLTAPIGVIIGASGAESRRGADYGVGLAPWAPKWAEQKLGSGSARTGFFRFFPEWSEMAWEGPGTIIWGSGGGGVRLIRAWAQGEYGLLGGVRLLGPLEYFRTDDPV